MPTDCTSTEGLPARVAIGTPAFRRLSFALFLGGFSTFSLIYCVQPLLPEFAQEFGVSPAESALALSLTTGALAVSIVLAGAFSQALGRRGLMFASMAAAAVLNLVAAVSPSWGLMLVARAFEGWALGGVPAVAMAYVSEEMEPGDLGAAMGLYISGTAFGGMAGRVGVGLMTHLISWRSAMGLLALADLAAAVAFILLLPPSRRFVRQRGLALRFHLSAWRDHLANPALRRLFGIAFALMAVFVTLFNYAGFRLKVAPYQLTQAQSSLIFLVYAFGAAASSTAGRFADRLGPKTPLMVGLVMMILGVAVTMAAPLPAMIAGIGVLTIGFFAAHSVASSWVGRVAQGTKGHAASLYLLFYYLGGSLLGPVGGTFWQHGGWAGVAGSSAAILMAALAVGATLGPQERR